MTSIKRKKRKKAVRSNTPETWHYALDTTPPKPPYKHPDMPYGTDCWLPLDDVLAILNKYNGGGGNFIGSDIKYVNLQIDTRDMHCQVKGGLSGNLYWSLEMLEDLAKKWCINYGDLDHATEGDDD